MYPITLPWIVYWSYVLIGKNLPRWYASFLPWIPAIGMITWQRAILHLDLKYLDHSEGILHPLKLMWQSQQNGWILLLGASIGTWFMDRRMSLILLCVTLGNGITEMALTTVVQSLHTKKWTQASLWLFGIECVRWLPLVFFWHNINQRRKDTKYLSSTTILMSLIALWISGPFVSLLIWAHPTSQPSTNVPSSLPALGMTLPVANPMSPNFASQLNAQGSTPLPKASWWCNTEAKPNWKSQHRAFTGIELPADLKLKDLRPHLFEIFQRGITHVGVLTKTTDSHWYPPLSKHLRYPVLNWYMTPPPTTARIAVIDTEGAIEWLRNGDTHCTLSLSWENTIRDATNAHQLLVREHQCAPNIFLSITASPRQQIKWEPPIPCPY